MEVHSPRSSVHSLKDFVLEIVMIVLGVLIALGVEQVREHFRERRVANEARENFRREIELERAAVKFYLSEMAGSRTAIRKFLDDEAAQKSRSLEPAPSFALKWQFLPIDGWQTAMATQAFAYMDPAEVQRYSLVHTSQTIFNDFEQRLHGVLMDLYAYAPRKDLTRDEQRVRNQDLRVALDYLDSIDQIGNELLRRFDEVAPGLK